MGFIYTEVAQTNVLLVRARHDTKSHIFATWLKECVSNLVKDMERSDATHARDEFPARNRKSVDELANHCNLQISYFNKDLQASLRSFYTEGGKGLPIDSTTGPWW